MLRPRVDGAILFGSCTGNDVTPYVLNLAKQVQARRSGSNKCRNSDSVARQDTKIPGAVLSHGITMPIIPEYLKPVRNSDDIVKGSFPGCNVFTLWEKRKMKPLSREQKLRVRMGER